MCPGLPVSDCEVQLLSFNEDESVIMSSMERRPLTPSPVCLRRSWERSAWLRFPHP